MTRRRARPGLGWAAIALALAAPARPAAAATATAGTTLAELSTEGAPPSDHAPLDLYVNGGQRDVVPVVLRGADALVPVEDLELAGLRGFAGSREVIAGRVYVSLASLAPALRFEVDEAGLALRLTASPALLGRTRLDLSPSVRPAGLLTGGDPAGFVNFSVQRRTDDRTAGFLEAGASARGRLLLTSGHLLPDGRAVRDLTSLTIDDPAAARRVVAGDVFPAGTGLGGGVLLGGLSVAREYALDPYLVRAPLPQLSGFAASPSTLDVYVNGVLRRQIPLPPGGYDLTNLPATAGAGQVRTVLRDAFGRSETLATPYYHTPSLLLRGLTDYGYAAGFRRAGYGIASLDYGRPVLVARHRVGATERLTAGGRLDAAADLLSLGPSFTVGLPFGTVDLEAAGSDDAGRLGAAASAGYGFVAPAFGASVLLRALSARYANAAVRASDDRARLQATASAGTPLLGRANLTAGWTASIFRDGPATGAVSVRADVRLAQHLSLGVTATRTRGGATAGWDAFATLSWSIAPLTVADVAAEGGRSGRGLHAGLERGLPAGAGLGGRLRGGTGPGGDDLTALLQGQFEHGRAEVQYDRVGGTGLGSATVAGALVIAGGRAFLTRPVQDGFALVRTGVPGVRAYAEGQEVGRTDARGDLLVPSLLSYYGNRLGIADRDVPALYEVGPTERLAAPPFRGAAVVRFEVSPLRAVEGTLVTGTGAPPAYGDLTVRAQGRDVSSPVGSDGRFFLEGLTPGTHAGSVDWSGGRCDVTLVVPADPPFADLGTLRCAPPPLVPVPIPPPPEAPTLPPPPPAELLPFPPPPPPAPGR